MSVESLHPDYEQFLAKWSRARDVIAGEDSIKAAGVRYLPRLESQTDEEYAAYVTRAAFFNGTARTAEGFSGMIFRRDPVVRLPVAAAGANVRNGGGERGAGSRETRDVAGAKGRTGEGSRRDAAGSAIPPYLADVFDRFEEDVDLLGTSLYLYAKRVTGEVLGVGRAGTLIEWNDEEERAFVALYQAEQIINWKTVRIRGRNVLGLVALKETVDLGTGDDPFESKEEEQIRVLRLIENGKLKNENFGKASGENARRGEGESSPGHAKSSARDGRAPQYVVEIWRREDLAGQATVGEKREWVLVERRVPMRRGKPLSAIPFVFHGPYDSQPNCAKPPLDDVIAVNLDHYRLDADYKHGLHFTALPTAWVSGFHKDSQLRIGSSTAWVTDTIGAHAGFLEFTGQGLTTFERAMDRAEKLMAILGSRLLETQKRVSESAEALSLRQAGEGSIVANISSSLSKSLTQILRWVYWWSSGPTGQSVEEELARIGSDIVSIELNQDFETATMTPQELVALVQAWQAGAVSTETLHNLMRRGELLEPARTNEEEEAAIKRDKRPSDQSTVGVRHGIRDTVVGAGPSGL